MNEGTGTSRSQQTGRGWSNRFGPPDHGLRQRIAAEVHARPFETMQAPLRVSHLAVKSGNKHTEAVARHLATLCEAHGVTPPAEDAEFFSVQLGRYRLRYERHTEFRTYTFVADGASGGSDPFAEMPAYMLPEDWLRDIPGKLVAAVHIAVRADDHSNYGANDLSDWLDPEAIVGSHVLDDSATVWTDFRLYPDSYSRILIQDRGLSARQTGRLVQTMLEIETYRLMALLAFPLARELAPDLREVDVNLGELTDRMLDSDSLSGERELLQELSHLAARLEQISSRTSYRFGASQAYYALVQRRIESLRERALPGLQTISEFMERRLAPAMNTCLASAERQQQIATRITRAGNLLRTRVDVALEEQNVDLLQSMDRRSRLQLRLQETVEAFSMVVLSYYAVGLIDYALEGVVELGLELPVKTLVGVSVPLVVLGVWLGIRIMRRRFARQEAADGA